MVLTADEDDKSQRDTVLTFVIHYSLTRLYEDVVGKPHLNNAVGGAPPMSSAFGLPMP